LIGQYIKIKDDDEHVIIYSRDKDYYQLVDEDVSVLRPADNIILTPKNFKGLFGYPHTNSLMLKCFEGDRGDGVPGVPGVALKTMLKYFPKFAEEEYTIDRIISEAVELYNKKKSKTLEAIIGSRRTVERNKILMDLKNPFVNEEAIQEIEIVKSCVLANENGQFDRSIQDVIKEFMSKGYSKFIYKRDLAEDINNFFMPYQRISAKEKEYTRQILQS
jgi:5'-3' exonuclease